MEFTPAERRALSDDVADRLSHAIVSGRLKPGQRITESQIADLLAVSRGPVREALARLTVQGLITRSANRGAVVVALSLEDVEEVCSLRANLELLAIQWLMRRPEAADLT